MEDEKRLALSAFLVPPRPNVVHRKSNLFQKLLLDAAANYAKGHFDPKGSEVLSVPAFGGNVALKTTGIDPHPAAGQSYTGVQFSRRF